MDHMPTTTPLGLDKVSYERLSNPAALLAQMRDYLDAVDYYLAALYPDNSLTASSCDRFDALECLAVMGDLAAKLASGIEGN